MKCAASRLRALSGPALKGKDERGVGHVKHNAIAGRRFTIWGALEAHLASWMREVVDTRVHGTTGEAPIARFEPRSGRLYGRSSAVRHTASSRDGHWLRRNSRRPLQKK